MWKKIATKNLLSHPRLTVQEDIVELPSGQQVPYLTFGQSPAAVMVICLRGDKVLLQKEYSYPPDVAIPRW